MSIAKEIQSAIDAVENIVEVLKQASAEITARDIITNNLLTQISDRDKIIATQEQEIADMKKVFSS